MPAYKVKVKWGKESYTIEANTEEDPIVFRAQLFALTGVQPERQKILCKGITLKENEWNIQLKDGAVILLLGTREELQAAPAEKPKFIEDMNETELATAMELPAGLTNLGNTCYMNATVQCLRGIPELRDALKRFQENDLSLASAQSITLAMKGVFDQMEKSSTVTPILLLQTLHIAFPQFAQTGENGGYRQQDANECLCELIRVLQQKLPAVEGPNSSAFGSVIDQFMGGSFDVEMRCTEAPDEEAKRTRETFLQLSCFISPEIKYMHSGLKLRLTEQLTKQSPSLGRDAVYTRTCLISRLPAYLTVQMVRFQFKGKEGINAKILKDIKFPIEFDAFELCTPALQQQLTPMRSRFKEVEDAALESTTRQKDNPAEAAAAAAATSKGESSKTRTLPFSFENDLGSNNSGYYTLQAVLTHQGRSSSSGHYVGWVRQKGDLWAKFDDDAVSQITSEDILRLSGGGDWHCAYVLIYGPKILQVPEEEEAAKDGAEEAIAEQLMEA